MAALTFTCPRCGGPLLTRGDDELNCTRDGLMFRRESDIWRFLLPERAPHFEQFIHDYESVRTSEGRGSASAEFYRALPYRDLSGKFASDWKIRAVSFDALRNLLLHEFPNPNEAGLLDLGAGNGWLSNRFSAEGFDCTAIDLLTNDFDGLGAVKNYSEKIICVQAEFARLPFQDHSAHVVVFNASVHYAEDYVEALHESLRVLRPAGLLILLDSPVYRDAASGRQMLLERKINFQTRFGFESDSIPSLGFLTYAGMQSLGRELSLEWTHLRPFYGLRWSLRPISARARGAREPAEFGLWVARKPA